MSWSLTADRPFSNTKANNVCSGADCLSPIPLKNLRLRLSHGSKELCSEFPEEQEVRVAQVLHSVRSRYPDIFQQWCDKEGHIRKSLPVFVNGVHIRYLEGMGTELKEGDEVYVIPLIAGG